MPGHNDAYAPSRLKHVLDSEVVCDIDFVSKRLDGRRVELEILVPEKALDGHIQSLTGERGVEGTTWIIMIFLS